ncbi:MAG TPA: ATP-binding protein [Opitutaceae bacterium]|nr:ATP-binding protein [Opitutaceae bacterium]
MPTESHSRLPVTYQGALREYLCHPDEATLRTARELGRAALTAGLGVFDLIRLHHQALTDGVLPDDRHAAARLAPALELFLLEALAPFEAANCGIRSAREKLEGLNHRLADRNEALAMSNAELEEELALRQQSEESLRESKDRYFELLQQAQAMEENLHDLSAQVLSAQEDDRKRISRELHAEIAQALTAVTVTLALLKKQAGTDPALRRNVAEAEQLLAHSMETVHCFARDLRPSVLDHLGVQSALSDHIAEFTRQTGIRTQLVAHPGLGQLDAHRGETLFRVVQEALQNVQRHAQATAAKVEFTVQDGTLGLDITDNGRAFNVADEFPPRRTGHFGLLGMQERVRHLGGSLAIESAPRTGTRIHVEIPLAAPAAEPPSGPPPAGSAAPILPGLALRQLAVLL